jgi:hypothetical protein
VEKNLSEDQAIEKVAGARLVVWAVRRGGYCLRVLDRQGETLRELKTRFSAGDHSSCGPTWPVEKEATARRAAEALAHKLEVAFVCRDEFRWKWHEPDEERPRGIGQLVYAEIDESLVFIERQTAEELAASHAAWNPPQTWGDLRAKIAPDHFDELCRLYDEDEPDQNALLDVNEFDAYVNGNWPGWPAQDMLAWVPQEVISGYGRIDDSFHSGKSLALPPNREDEIVAAFRRHRYECNRADSLVRRACGYSNEQGT